MSASDDRNTPAPGCCESGGTSPRRKSPSGVRQAARLCLDVLLPPTCPSCGASIIGHSDEGWCLRCGLDVLDSVGREYCSSCGRNTGPYERVEGQCAECQNHRGPLAGLVRVGSHEGALHRALIEFKFHKAPHDRTLGRLLAASLQGASWLGRVDALVPIPMHWWRRVVRGQHVTKALARVAGSMVGIPVAEVLRRKRYSRPQVGLTRAQRAENIRGAFTVIRGARLKEATLCLIDDVTTTGATLTEAARTLRKAGAAEVYAAVVTKSDSTITL